MHRKMRARHHPKRRDFGGQVIQVIQHADQARAASLVSENLRAVRLAVGVQADAGMAGLGSRVAVSHEDDLVAEQRPQEFQGHRMGDQIGDRAAQKLEVAAHSLVDAIIHRDRFEPCGFSL